MKLQITTVFAFAAALGCGLGPRTSLEQHPLTLVSAKHAISVPLQAFAVPIDHGSVDDVSKCTPPASIPLQYAIVEVAPDAMYAGGVRLEVAMTDGVVHDDDKRGMLINGLYMRLLEIAEQTKDSASRGCAPWVLHDEPTAFPGRLLIAVDERVPWETMQDVLFTAGQAQYQEFYLQVDDPSPDPMPVRQDGPPKGADRTVLVRSDGTLELSLPGFTPSVLPADVLAAKLTHAATPVMVMPSGGLRSVQVVRAIDQVAGSTSPIVLSAVQHPSARAAAGSSEGAVHALRAGVRLSALRVRLPVVQDLAALPPKQEVDVDLGRRSGMAPEIVSVVERHGNQIRYCYQRELTHHPMLTGSLLLEVDIRPDGSVLEAKMVGSTLDNAAVEDCVVGRFRRMRFPTQVEQISLRDPLEFGS